MNILHIAAHLGDGAGKAIGGMAILDTAAGNQTRIMLLQEPKKKNHIERCLAVGIEFPTLENLETELAWADVVVLNWWGSSAMDVWLRSFPDVPCRVVLWMHKNGFFDPPLSTSLVSACDGLMVTSPFTQEKWPDACLVYGFGDFDPEPVPVKINYDKCDDSFVIGYIGSPSYKKLPADTVQYMRAVLRTVPQAKFVMAGETTEEFVHDLEMAELSSHIEMLGWVADVYGLMHSFDAFGYLLRADTFATTENAVLEALACGLPVVMPREPIGKYILGETGGVLIASPDEYAEAMKCLAESVDYRRQMGQQGRKRVLETSRGKSNAQNFQKYCKTVMEKEKKMHRF